MWLYFLIPFYETPTVGSLNSYGDFRAYKDTWFFFNNFWFFPLKKEEQTFDGKYRYAKSNGNIVFGIFDEDYENGL